MKKLWMMMMICSAIIAKGDGKKGIKQINSCNFMVRISPHSFSCDSLSTATANVLGGIPPYSYSWSNGETTPTITGLATGTYKVFATDSSGCKDSIIAYVDSSTRILQKIVVTNAATATSCDGTAKIIIQNSWGPYYSWCDGQSTDSISGLCKGNYCVYVCDSLLLCCDSVHFNIGFLSSVNMLSQNENFILYPNPSNNILTVQFSEIEKKQASFHLYDAVGREFFPHSEIKKDEIELNISALPSGIYFLKIKEDEMERVMKIVKE